MRSLGLQGGAAQQSHNMSRLHTLLGGTEELNPGLVCTQDELSFNGIRIHAHQEACQLYFRTEGCRVGKQHFRCLTPHAVCSGTNMRCAFCNHSWRIDTEATTAVALLELGMDCIAVAQWQPKWWHGRVDFHLLGSGSIIQVDGTAHFAGVYRKKQMPALMQQDRAFQQAAWAAGARVFRIHHKDLEQPVLDYMLCLAHAGSSTIACPALVLSPSYANVSWRCTAKQHLVSYASHMQEALDGSVQQNLHSGAVCLTL